MKIRPKSERLQCAVLECRNYPGENLYGRSFCDFHAEQFRCELAKRRFDALAHCLKGQGISERVRLEETSGFAPSKEETHLRLAKFEVTKDTEFGRLDRKNPLCSFPNCSKPAVATSKLFQPYKPGNWVLVCKNHEGVLAEIVRGHSGEKLLWESERTPSPPKDPVQKKRIETIRTAAAMYKGKSNYIQNVCRDLQKRKIPMLDRWLTRWERKLGERFEKNDWLRALKNADTKSDVQRYISRHAR